MGELVWADIGADGLLESLRLSPQAMRLTATELAAHIVSAVRVAQQAGRAIDPATMVRRLDEMQAQADLGFTRLTTALDEALRRLDHE
jgi:hypothetical protein